MYKYWHSNVLNVVLASRLWGGGGEERVTPNNFPLLFLGGGGAPERVTPNTFALLFLVGKVRVVDLSSFFVQNKVSFVTKCFILC